MEHIEQTIAEIKRELKQHPDDAQRMNELGVSWNLTTDFIAYTPFDIEPWLRAEVVPKIGTAVANGIRWFPGHAPVGGGGIEMGTYGVIQDIRVALE